MAITLRTLSSIEGLPVIVQSSGYDFGEVIDVLIEHGKVTSLLIDQAGWFNKHLVLPLNKIVSYGKDGMMVEHSDACTAYSKKNKGLLLLKNGKQRLQGVPLLTKEGTKLGLIEDVYFHGKSGTIIGYEVTDGLVADLLEGRKIVKHKAELVVRGGRAILTE